MKKQIPAVMFLLLCATANAASITVNGGYDDVISTKYGDAKVASIRIESPFMETKYGTLAATGEYHHVGKSWHPNCGWLSGHGLLGGVVYRPLARRGGTLPSRFDPYLLAEAGYYYWDWTNSEQLNAAGIRVDLGDAFGAKGAIGLDYHLDAHWSLNGEIAYYGSEYKKNAYYADGTQSHVIGDDTLGNEGIVYSAGIRYEF